MRSWFCPLLACLVFKFFATGIAAAQPQPAFERAMKAFRAADYAAALEAFLEARRLGDDSPALRYNLGVTYYRLERYSAAAREFRGLSRDPDWAPLARYNLGLVARRLGRRDAAAAHFRAAREAAVDPGLRALAGAALERLGRAPPVPGTSVSAALAAGYDSNVALAPDAQAVALADNNDFFWEANGVLVHPLDADGARGLYLHGGVYWRDYASVHEFDQHGLRAGLRREVESGAWQTTAGVRLDTFYVDRNRFQDDLALDLEARRFAGGGRDVRVRYQFARIDGGVGFAHLDGWRQRLTIDIGGGSGDARWRLGYQLEVNDRDDLRRDAEFFSYSPTEHVLFTGFARSLADGWRLTARAEYQARRYPDPTVIDGGTTELDRRDDYYSLHLRAERRCIGTSSRPFIDYSYTANESNLRAYDYGRHQVMAGVEGVW